MTAALSTICLHNAKVTCIIKWHDIFWETFLQPDVISPTLVLDTWSLIIFIGCVWSPSWPNTCSVCKRSSALITPLELLASCYTAEARLQCDSSLEQEENSDAHDHTLQSRISLLSSPAEWKLLFITYSVFIFLSLFVSLCYCCTTSEITSRYNWGMQQSICEAITRTTLRWMGYNSRRAHRVPLISTTNRKKRQQFVRAHQNWTVDDWKIVAWSDESWFLLRHSEWEHGSIMPCYHCAGCCWCNGVRDVFLAHFRPLSANWASFQCHGLPEHCFWPCPPLWPPSPYPLMATSSRIMHHVTNNFKLLSWTWLY